MIQDLFVRFYSQALQSELAASYNFEACANIRFIKIVFRHLVSMIEVTVQLCLYVTIYCHTLNCLVKINTSDSSAFPPKYPFLLSVRNDAAS